MAETWQDAPAYCFRYFPVCPYCGGLDHHNYGTTKDEKEQTKQQYVLCQNEECQKKFRIIWEIPPGGN